MMMMMMMWSPVNSPYKGQWRGALMFFLICASTTVCVNNRDAGDLRHHRVHYHVTLMNPQNMPCTSPSRANYGVFIVSIYEKMHRHIWVMFTGHHIHTGVHCIYTYVVSVYNKYRFIGILQQQTQVHSWAWLSHDMEILSAIFALCTGSPAHHTSFVQGTHTPPMNLLHTGPIIRSFGVFIAVILNKLLNKQSSCRSFEAPWPPCDFNPYDNNNNNYNNNNNNNNHCTCCNNKNNNNDNITIIMIII